MRLPYATTYFHYGSEPAIRLAGRLAELAPGDLEPRVLHPRRIGCGGHHPAADPDTTGRALVASPQRTTHRLAGTRLSRLLLQRRVSVTAHCPCSIVGFGLPVATQHYIRLPRPVSSCRTRMDAAIIASSLAALQARSGTPRAGVRWPHSFASPSRARAACWCPRTAGCGRCGRPAAAHGILFIADEVITGFGRTGPMFACEPRDAITPDFMTVAKGLTSGYAPMGAVLIADPVYQRDRRRPGRQLRPRGTDLTYSAHPVSAAVGIGGAAPLHRRGAAGKRPTHGRSAAGRTAPPLWRNHPLVGDVRGRGMLAALELVSDKAAKTPLAAITWARPKPWRPGRLPQSA